MYIDDDNLVFAEDLLQQSIDESSDSENSHDDSKPKCSTCMFRVLLYNKKYICVWGACMHACVYIHLII